MDFGHAAAIASLNPFTPTCRARSSSLASLLLRVDQRPEDGKIKIKSPCDLHLDDLFAVLVCCFSLLRLNPSLFSGHFGNTATTNQLSAGYTSEKEFRDHQKIPTAKTRLGDRHFTRSSPCCPCGNVVWLTESLIQQTAFRDPI